ncbi:MAG: hypothetical protein ACKOEM_01500 [Planctomycetia bacterium]
MRAAQTADTLCHPAHSQGAHREHELQLAVEMAVLGIRGPMLVVAGRSAVAALAPVWAEARNRNARAFRPERKR